MTPKQIRAVHQSFAKIEPIAKKVGESFYNKLFSLAPDTRKLFPEDMSKQHAAYMNVVAQLVNLHLRSLITLPVTQAENAEAAMPEMRKLGKDHKAWGVIPAHFGLMRRCLMEAISEILGDDFTPELQEAWAAAYDVMSRVMQNGLLETGPISEQFLGRFGDDADAPRCPVAKTSSPTPPLTPGE
jgi:hemoglobin-like flavoprotein